MVVRFRPLNQAEEETALQRTAVDENTFEIEGASNSIRDTRSQKVYSTLNTVCEPRTTQAEVYNHVANELVKGVFEGFNAGIFCYGQVGALRLFCVQTLILGLQSGGGKSYSLFGREGDLRGDYRGLLPRCLQHIMEEAALKVSRAPSSTSSCHFPDT